MLSCAESGRTVRARREAREGRRRCSAKKRHDPCTVFAPLDRGVTSRKMLMRTATRAVEVGWYSETFALDGFFRPGIFAFPTQRMIIIPIRRKIKK